MTDTQLQPIAVRIKEACRLTGIGRSKLYELISDGHIEIVKVGVMTLVPVESLRGLIDRGRQGELK
ncbi:excisionase family DNA binding protein [Sphingomonas sp. BE270]|jgi:excisionase family DNA binding protein|uniref:helix-turn-helix domain-containing protein n=1 Tax=unclassified Sphingomonas TaxID=196159 RepID=UPI00053DADAD|nr:MULTISPECIES: helix-turn-helix domain-containing protein [unclassified Sphingomonas]MDR7257218.1 excisionase family DNA binding protein [Sphingomonas sp. BE270]